MLKQFLIIFFILFNCTINSAFAQDTTKTKLNKWGVGLQVNTIEKYFPFDNPLAETRFNDDNSKWTNNSFSCGLLGIYFLNNNFSIRMKTGIINVNRKSHRDNRDEYDNGAPLNNYSVSDGQVKQTRYYFSPEISSMISQGKITFYGGMGIPLTIFKNFTSDTHSIDYTDSTYTKVLADGNTLINIPGGFSVGLSALVGFNLHPVKHFSFGAEITFAYLYQQLGGKVEETNQGTYLSNYYYGYGYHSFSEKGFTLSKGVLTINITYSF